MDHCMSNNTKIGQQIMFVFILADIEAASSAESSYSSPNSSSCKVKVDGKRQDFKT